MDKIKSSKEDSGNTEYLKLFLYTVECYERISRGLPISWGADRYKMKLDEEYAAINVRALLLRKYITKSDGVFLETIIDKAAEELPKCVPELNAIRKDYQDAYSRQVAQTLADGSELNLREIFDDIVYGTFLHADLNRVERLMKSKEYMALYCMRGFIHSVEVLLVRLKELLLENGVQAFQEEEHQKAVTVSFLETGEKPAKEITGYWSNLYGKEVEDDEALSILLQSKDTEENQIMACALLFLSKLEDLETTIDDLKDVVFWQTRRDWGDLSEARQFLNSVEDRGLATTVNFNQRRDVAHVKVMENVKNTFVVNAEQLIPAHFITLIKDEDIDKWRVFSFGGLVDPYLDRG